MCQNLGHRRLISVDASNKIIMIFKTGSTADIIGLSTSSF